MRQSTSLGAILRTSDGRRDRRRVFGGYQVRSGQISHALREYKWSEYWVRWMEMPLSARRLRASS